MSMVIKCIYYFHFPVLQNNLSQLMMLISLKLLNHRLL